MQNFKPLESSDLSIDNYKKILDKKFLSTYEIFLKEDKKNTIKKIISFFKKNKKLNILEIGFGIGRNFSFILSEISEKFSDFKLHYVGVEKHPVSKEFLNQIHDDNFFKKNIICNWPFELPGNHRLWNDQFFCLDLYYGEAEQFLEKYKGEFDLIIFDAYDGNINPSLWNKKIPYQLLRLSHTNSCILFFEDPKKFFCYFEYAGWVLEDHLIGKLKNSYLKKNNTEFIPKKIAMIGAGLAGAIAAYEFCQQGHQVYLFESNLEPAQGASGNPAGIFHPHLSVDDAYISQLSRIGVELTKFQLKNLTDLGILNLGKDWDLTGHVQLFESIIDEKKYDKALLNMKFPEQWVCKLSGSQIENLLNSSFMGAGLYFSQGGWVKPNAWVKGVLNFAQKTKNLKFFNGCLVNSCCKKNGKWILEITDNHLEKFDDFDCVVLACAAQHQNFFQQNGAKGTSIKGQISLINYKNNLNKVISGASYVIPMNTEQLIIGASFDLKDQTDGLTNLAHQNNLAQFSRVFSNESSPKITGGRASFRYAWQDHLPAIGPATNDQGELIEGLYLLTAYGSRGITWAVLGAQVLVDLIDQRNGLLTQDLLTAVLPERFVSRASNSKPVVPSDLSTK